jgi:hypothetical protein
VTRSLSGGVTAIVAWLLFREPDLSDEVRRIIGPLFADVRQATGIVLPLSPFLDASTDSAEAATIQPRAEMVHPADGGDSCLARGHRAAANGIHSLCGAGDADQPEACCLWRRTSPGQGGSTTETKGR